VAVVAMVVLFIGLSPVPSSKLEVRYDSAQDFSREGNRHASISLWPTDESKEVLSSGRRLAKISCSLPLLRGAE